MTAGALVIGGDYRALGIVRSLGRKGVPVWVLTNEHRVACASRYCQEWLAWPRDENEQVPFLIDLCDRRGIHGWALFPSDDETTALLAHHHEELSKRFLMTTPAWREMRWAYDKRLTHQLACDAGVEQPWTAFPKSRAEVAGLPCAFPVILKPAFKRQVNTFTRDKAWRVNNREELLTRYDEAGRFVDTSIIMVQELIDGDGRDQFSYAALCTEGKTSAFMTARRTRQYPSDFGRASSFVESVDVPEIQDASQKLLRATEITGVVEVEFKRSRKTGAFKLLDLNSRVWGWHTLGWCAGLDFPYLLWRMVHGETIPEMRGASGARWIRMLTDLPTAASEIRAGSLKLRDYLQSFRRPLEFAIYAKDDPLPAILDVPYLVWLAWKRARYPALPRQAADMKASLPTT